MPNVTEYAKTEFATFEKRPFSDVDSLALSFLAYITVPKELEAAWTWEGMRIAELYRAEHFTDYYKGLWAEKSGLEILIAMAASPRFRDIKLARFVEKIDQDSQMQFSAMSFLLPNGMTYVAYKGTDATFVGWKEDFNLSFQCPVPSQIEAVTYLTEVAAQCPGPVRMGGHSKGGNLAIYAAAECGGAIQARIERVYSHDGPGFFEEFTQSVNYLKIANRIEKTIPQSSVIGMLMEEGDYSVVKSTAVGLWQHDPSTWLVEDGGFVWADKLANDALFAESTISEWLRGCTREEREEFVNALYSVIEGSDAIVLTDLIDNPQNVLPAMAKALVTMAPEKKNLAIQMIGDLVAIGVRNVPGLLGIYDVPAVKGFLEAREKYVAAKKNASK